MSELYRIVKFWKDKPGSVYGMPKHLTLDEAKRYCQREDTKGKDWFCGFTRE